MIFSFEKEFVDSLLTKLNSSSVKEKIDTYADLMTYYNRIKPEKSIAYGEKALQIARAGHYKKGEGDILYLLGSGYYVQSEYSEALKYYELAYKIRREINERVGIGECLNKIGVINNVRGNFDKALDYCLQSVSLLEGEHDKKALAQAYNHLGIIYYILNDIPKARENTQKAMLLCKTDNEALVLAASLENMGIIYIKLKEYDKALSYTLKGFEIRSKKNDKIGVSGSYENLAIIYRNLKNYPKALGYYNKSLATKNELKNKRGIASSISGIGVTYFYMGQYAKSLSYLRQAFEKRKELSDKRGIVSSLNSITETYYALKDYKNAFEFHKLARVYSDSLLNEQKNNAIASLNEAFNSERRDKEILLLQRENTIQKQLQNFLLTITLLLFAIAIIIFAAYRSKRKVNTLLVKNNNEITVQKEELIRLNEQLKELNTTKDRFFSIIAHDLKSPFQGFLGMTELFAENANSFSAEELAHIGKNMHRSADSLFSLLKNLLEWAQMQKGQISFEPKEIPLDELIAKNIEMLKERSKQKGISVINNTEQNMIVSVDEKMIHSILLNLLFNSIKFTHRDGTITVSAKKSGYEMIEVAVSDTGVGIAADKVEKLFKLGEEVKGKRGTEQEESSGLGLLLCKEFVEKHGGRIWVESEEGKGSTFYFTVPGK